MEDRSRRALRLLSVHAGDTDPISPDTLRDALPASSLSVARSVAAALDLCGEATDCVITPFELPDGTALDLEEALRGDASAPPVVLVVDGSDGTVPTAAVTGGFAAVATVGERSDAAAVAEAVAEAVPATTDPSVADPHPRDGRSMNAWKATLFDQYFTQIPLHMFVKDRAGRHLVVSEGPVRNRIHGASEAYLGRRDVDGIVPVSEARGSYEDDRAVIDRGEVIGGKEEYFATSDRWFRTSKAPWKNDDGDVIGLVGVAEEITARKDREEQLEILSHVVRHSMRNNLNVVMGYCESLQGGGSLTSAELAAVLSATRQMTSRIEKQQTIIDIMVGTPDPVETDLSTVTRTVLERARAEHADATVTGDVAAETMGMVTENFHHALTELIENAVVHGGDAPEVHVSLVESGDEIRVEIRDRGRPIPTFEVEVLTGDRSVDQLTHSSGLGLWVARWAVKHAGGEIDFARHAAGNEVTVTVPAARATSPGTSR